MTYQRNVPDIVGFIDFHERISSLPLLYETGILSQLRWLDDAPTRACRGQVRSS